MHVFLNYCGLNCAICTWLCLQKKMSTTELNKTFGAMSTGAMSTGGGPGLPVFTDGAMSTGAMSIGNGPGLRCLLLVRCLWMPADCLLMVSLGWL